MNESNIYYMLREDYQIEAVSGNLNCFNDYLFPD